MIRLIIELVWHLISLQEPQSVPFTLWYKRVTVIQSNSRNKRCISLPETLHINYFLVTFKNLLKISSFYEVYPLFKLWMELSQHLSSFKRTVLWTATAQSCRRRQSSKVQRNSISIHRKLNSWCSTSWNNFAKFRKFLFYFVYFQNLRPRLKNKSGRKWLDSDVVHTYVCGMTSFSFVILRPFDCVLSILVRYYSTSLYRSLLRHIQPIKLRINLWILFKEKSQRQQYAYEYYNENNTLTNIEVSCIEAEVNATPLSLDL